MSELTGEKTLRRIRSFVLRTGRMTEGQKRAYDFHWPSKGLEVASGSLDLTEVFGREAPTVLEIGFGMGDSLAAMAEAAPDHNFIGVEVHRPGVGRLMHLIDEAGLTNLRAYCHDAVEVLETCIPDERLSRVQVYFPDPWHKKKHHKRRLIQADFVQLLRRKLKLGGVIHLATDWENYAEHMMEVMTAADGFSNQAGELQFSPRPEYRPVTKFEKRGERLGHGVWDLLFERVS
ncbi:tRNA (guanosine(46)-N7)-methyltransferase TrmB [Spongiibacter taiwanensis]|uniref:tRNA (guanosine(46)-N7)-methyltransferase TrmB n=1 Tax=Spongiibacter taiwanensis TaxID=1748242 RepID=UPI002034BF65|nr:tRNA (guanosine(46)-N7)-methyltransferase TrmB [Spongiibacter taiwanensis]USA42159.1 tRNA (guanosine(46)-N7)-methyltransferase TrmB [Spongiibacter taiwanensis]